MRKVGDFSHIFSLRTAYESVSFAVHDRADAAAADSDGIVRMGENTAVIPAGMESEPVVERKLRAVIQELLFRADMTDRNSSAKALPQTPERISRESKSATIIFFIRTEEDLFRLPQIKISMPFIRSAWI